MFGEAKVKIEACCIGLDDILMIESVAIQFVEYTPGLHAWKPGREALEVHLPYL